MTSTFNPETDPLGLYAFNEGRVKLKGRGRQDGKVAKLGSYFCSFSLSWVPMSDQKKSPRGSPIADIKDQSSGKPKHAPR